MEVATVDILIIENSVSYYYALKRFFEERNDYVYNTEVFGYRNGTECFDRDRQKNNILDKIDELITEKDSLTILLNLCLTESEEQLNPVDLRHMPLLSFEIGLEISKKYPNIPIVFMTTVGEITNAMSLKLYSPYGLHGHRRLLKKPYISYDAWLNEIVTEKSFHSPCPYLGNCTIDFKYFGEECSMANCFYRQIVQVASS